MEANTKTTTTTTTEETRPSIFEYEGAGTILYAPTKDAFILGKSVKSGEFEYAGGKVESVDKDPLGTALSELAEEVGSIDSSYPIAPDRSAHILVYQPFSKKWIWCFTHRLTETEEARLKALDDGLEAWGADEVRDLSALTGRSHAVKKALTGLYYVKRADFFEYIEKFTQHEPRTDNRMKDAKAYGADPKTKLLTGKRVRDESEVVEARLRGFNAVMFEQHLKKLKESFE